MRSTTPKKDNFCGKIALVAFAKNPELVPVKTRLAKSVGRDAAEQIYLAMLNDSLQELTQVSGTKTYLACYPDDNHSFFHNLATKFGVQLIIQRGDNLGERMSNCVEDLLPVYEAVVIFGTDIPLLPISSINSAFRSMSQWNILIGPDADGGYWAIGARRLMLGHFARVFEGIEWSTNSVLSATIKNCQRLNLKVKLLDVAIDVDDLKAITQLKEALKQNHTGAYSTRATLQHLGLLETNAEKKYISSI